MSEETQNSDFKKSLKTTSLFGGVQIYQILIKIISSKFVAVLLGPTGMGINGLLQSTTQIISSVAGMGLGTSAVRDMASSYATHDKGRFYRTLSVFRNLVWYTGLLGTVICLVGAPLWSKVSFGNYEYTWSFILISITILFGQISIGQTALLQGTGKFKYMAKSSLIGSTIGLILNIPLYYFFGYKGIVPAIIAASIASLVLSSYFAKKIPYEKVQLTHKEVFHEGKTMVSLGFFLMLQSFFELLCGYLVRIYVSNTGSLEDVGLYNSGFTLVNTYVGMVFTAMSTEYYPRLSTYANDYKKFNNAINQQIEISLLLIGPMISLFLVFGDLVVILLLSHKFLPITWMINWAMLAIFFRAGSNSIAMAFVAKADTKAFWINELFANTVILIFNIIGYHLYGLTGLGLSYLAGYFYYNVQIIITTKLRYGYTLDLNLLKSFIPQVLISLAIIGVYVTLGEASKYIIGVILVAASVYISYRSLNKYVDVKAFVMKKLNRG
jgi:O-antigen/teichoic acid export membrane protein